MNKILVTGAKGFIGRNTARYFKSLGYEVYGIGHGELCIKDYNEIGLDCWYESDISIKAIKNIGKNFDVVVHCGGGGSVGDSIENPYQDFKKTVNGTLEVLEYIRLYNSSAHLIYPSSPAVQGERKDEPINEECTGNPKSPYGYHKKIAEDLCRSYSDKYDLKISIIRLFSVYGNGMKKQILWDAYNKFIDAGGSGVAEFWGTGEETRDFIHIDDVVKLIHALIALEDRFFLINGGTGVKITIKEVVYLIRDMLGLECKINFNKTRNEGNPDYYWASTNNIKVINELPEVKFEHGLIEYIKWVKSI